MENGTPTLLPLPGMGCQVEWGCLSCQENGNISALWLIRVEGPTLTPRNYDDVPSVASQDCPTPSCPTPGALPG